MNVKMLEGIVVPCDLGIGRGEVPALALGEGIEAVRAVRFGFLRHRDTVQIIEGVCKIRKLYRLK